MQINSIQSNNNTSFTAFRFTKSAKVYIKDTFTTEDILELKNLVKEHKNISPNVLVGTDSSLFGSTRLRARIDGDEFSDSTFFEGGLSFLKDVGNYAKDVYYKLGDSASEVLKNI